MFFQELYKVINDGVDVTLTISKPVHGKLSVLATFKPKGKEAEKVSLQPLVVSGTPADLDSAFVQQFKNIGQSVTGLVSNYQTVKENVTKETDKARKSVKKTAKAAAKDEAPAQKQEGLFK